MISLRSTKPHSQAIRSQKPRTESLNLVFWYQNTRLSRRLDGLYQKALDGQRQERAARFYFFPNFQTQLSSSVRPSAVLAVAMTRLSPGLENRDCPYFWAFQDKGMRGFGAGGVGSKL